MSCPRGASRRVMAGVCCALLAVAIVAASRAAAVCGNSITEAGEQCDLGAANGTSASCCTASCQFKANGASCSDGQFCTGTDTCQSGACTGGTNPCSGFCSEALNACLPSGCPGGPVVGCRTAEKSILLIKNKATDDSKDKLIWKWIKGKSVTFAQLSDPLTTADYALCVFSPNSVLQIHVTPDNVRWAASGTKGYKFADDAAAQDGARKIILKGSDKDTSKALVQAGGANLDDPLNSGPLPLPVKVQLINHRSGVCFESVFSAAVSNSDTIFKATSP